MPSFMCSKLDVGYPPGGRYLPKSYPNWASVYSCFRRWSRNGTWDKVVEALRVEMRYAQGRGALPTAAVIDTA
ncbi:hypothetical protein IAD21_00217 [Abditibacteriota bacterium]|nr:hypothetical protein IAD21_00217 [Abditibacteriota bacterium]